MSEQPIETKPDTPPVQTVRVFKRFSLGQRWEHVLLMLSFTVLLLTGLPQRYRDTGWSQQILATPESVILVQTIHRIAAVVLIVEVLYHLGAAFYQMARRRLSADIFITWQDVRDAGQMVGYLLFLRKDKPAFGKYNFEQKITYWFIFVGVGIMVVTGLILWFPETVTWVLPGSVVPASLVAHSTEAIVAAIFIVLWHFFHVHLERLNLSIFSGKMNEDDMKTYHALEYERLTGENTEQEGGNQP
jgi:formate dehydrogenase gamma subunit